MEARNIKLQCRSVADRYFYAYTLGLRTVEASRAGILATIEPLVATLVGILFFSESFTIVSGLGIVFILAAVILLNWKQHTI